MRRNFEAKLTCRSCGRTLRESSFGLGMKCVDCTQHEENRKQRAIEHKIRNDAREPRRRYDG
jgi:hypothetical protein